MPIIASKPGRVGSKTSGKTNGQCSGWRSKAPSGWSVASHCLALSSASATAPSVAASWASFAAPSQGAFAGDQGRADEQVGVEAQVLCLRLDLSEDFALLRDAVDVVGDVDQERRCSLTSASSLRTPDMKSSRRALVELAAFRGVQVHPLELLDAT